MKNTHICPKCQNSGILKIRGTTGAYGTGNNIPVGWTNFSAVLVDRYVCERCGYSEEWIDTEDIHKLKKKYGK